jgi:glutathione peroxidase
MTTAIEQIPFTGMDGSATSLAAYPGTVRLLVNVASQCGLTPQYAGLEKLFTEKQAAGLVVIGFPANEFGAQEPGSNEEIATFCTRNFGVSFPLAQKIVVKGEGRHALYEALTAAQPTAIDTNDGAFETKLAGYGLKRDTAADVLWNFEKFLVGRNGEVVARFNPDVAPDDARLVAAIDAELAKPAA